MIILLKEDTVFKPTAELNQALDNIAYQCRSGNHVLTGERNLLSRLADSPGLDARTAAIIRQASQRMTQQGILLKRSPLVLEVDVSNSSSTEPHLSEFVDPDLCEKAQLLTENPTDANTLFYLAEEYLHNQLAGYRLSLRRNNGGGSTIASTLKQMTDSSSGRVLCVVDSDRIFQGARLGSTAKAAKEAQKKVKPKWRSILHIIEQRELENIVPVDVRDHCIKSYAPTLLGTSRSLELTDRFYSDYFCFKGGDSMCRVVGSLISKKQHSKLTAARAAAHGSPLEEQEPCGTCINDQSCKRSKGFGSGFLGWVSEELRSKRVISDPSSWRDDLMVLVEKVAFLGIGNQPTRI